MPLPRSYMAASVPQYVRQTKLAYLSTKWIIGSYLVEAATSMVFDVIMLPVPEFQRMRGHIGLQHVFAPTLHIGPNFSPSFIPTDTKEIVVPDHIADPESYARDYFRCAFGLTEENPDPAFENTEIAQTLEEIFRRNAQECAARKS